MGDDVSEDGEDRSVNGSSTQALEDTEVPWHLDTGCSLSLVGSHDATPTDTGCIPRSLLGLAPGLGYRCARPAGMTTGSSSKMRQARSQRSLLHLSSMS